MQILQKKQFLWLLSYRTQNITPNRLVERIRINCLILFQLLGRKSDWKFTEFECGCSEFTHVWKEETLWISKVLSLLPPHSTNPCTAAALLAQPLEQLTGRSVSLEVGGGVFVLFDRYQDTINNYISRYTRHRNLLTPELQFSVNLSNTVLRI